MRNNLPVTQRVKTFPREHTLISITDLKGRITYCNQDFIEVSGYAQGELLGQPHNILRHPDMPAEAFRDCWETIQKGELWSAPVKNRCKNGDSYWVHANATPMRNGEKIVGYLSVRTRPTDAEISAAETLYATMRDEAANGQLKHVLRGGAVERRDLPGRISQALDLVGHHRVTLLVLLASFVPLLAADAGLPAWAQWLAAAVVALAIGMCLNTLATRPAQAAIHVSRKLASGDLSNFVATTGRGVARSLLQPISQLGLSIRTVMRDVRMDLDRLQGATREIAASSRDLSARTEAQAASLEETAAAMDQISGMVQQTADLATQGVQQAEYASSTAKRSQEAVHEMAQTMQDITESSRRIGDLIQSIEGVAFQTNILALNAAVEAARVGEQGRGFAVVASEVRALALRTTNLSKEVQALVSESENRVARGSAHVSETRARMDDAMDSVRKVGQVLQDIDHAAREQAQGVVQIGQAIQQMDGITQQNTALVGQLAAAAGRMDAQTEEARFNINVFRLSPQDTTHAETDAVQLRKHQRSANRENLAAIAA